MFYLYLNICLCTFYNMISQTFYALFDTKYKLCSSLGFSFTFLLKLVVLKPQTIIDFVKQSVDNFFFRETYISFLLWFFCFCQTIGRQTFMHVFPNGTKFYYVFCWTSWLSAFSTQKWMTPRSTNDCRAVKLHCTDEFSKFCY